MLAAQHPASEALGLLLVQLQQPDQQRMRAEAPAAHADPELVGQPARDERVWDVGDGERGDRDAVDTRHGSQPHQPGDVEQLAVELLHQRALVTQHARPAPAGQLLHRGVERDHPDHVR